MATTAGDAGALQGPHPFEGQGQYGAGGHPVHEQRQHGSDDPSAQEETGIFINAIEAEVKLGGLPKPSNPRREWRPTIVPRWGAPPDNQRATTMATVTLPSKASAVAVAHRLDRALIVVDHYGGVMRSLPHSEAMKMGLLCARHQRELAKATPVTVVSRVAHRAYVGGNRKTGHFNPTAEPANVNPGHTDYRDQQRREEEGAYQWCGSPGINLAVDALDAFVQHMPVTPDGLNWLRRPLAWEGTYAPAAHPVAAANNICILQLPCQVKQWKARGFDAADRAHALKRLVQDMFEVCRLRPPPEAAIRLH